MSAWSRQPQSQSRSAISMIAGGAVSMVTVAAVFLSNVPEGLSSSAGMKNADRSKAYIFGLWTAITVISGISSLIGYAVFRHFNCNVIAATIAVAAGAILSMIVLRHFRRRTTSLDLSR